MDIFTQENINTGSYIFLFMGGVAAFAGAIVVYLDRKAKLSKRKIKK
ncbi:MAG: hypothetical protein AAB948_02995 [Patescibacteria group bacterium]